MKLSTKAIKKLNRSVVLKIADEMGYTERWVYKMISLNQENGTLTTYTAVRIIRENTGMEDAEILAESRKLKKRRAAVRA